MALGPDTTPEDQITVDPFAIALEGDARIFLGLRENLGGLFVEQVGSDPKLTRLSKEHISDPSERRLRPAWLNP